MAARLRSIARFIVIRSSAGRTIRRIPFRVFLPPMGTSVARGNGVPWADLHKGLAGKNILDFGSRKSLRSAATTGRKKVAMDMLRALAAAL